MAPSKVLPASTCEEVENAINYNFVSRELLWEALQAAGNGVRFIKQRKVPDGNKRLAMLGDAVLQLVVLGEWYAGGEKRQVGNEVVQRLCSNRNLDSLGRVLNLEYFINPNPHQKGIIYPATMTATVEALIAAVYLDGGIEAATKLTRHWGLCNRTEEVSGVRIPVPSITITSATRAEKIFLNKQPVRSISNVSIEKSQTSSDDGELTGMRSEACCATSKDADRSESTSQEQANCQSRENQRHLMLNKTGQGRKLDDFEDMEIADHFPSANSMDTYKTEDFKNPEDGVESLHLVQNRTEDEMRPNDSKLLLERRGVNSEDDTESEDSSESLTLGVSEAEEDDDLDEGAITLPKDSKHHENNDEEEDGGVKLSGGELRALSNPTDAKDGHNSENEFRQTSKYGFMMWI